MKQKNTLAIFRTVQKDDNAGGLLEQLKRNPLSHITVADST